MKVWAPITLIGNGKYHVSTDGCVRSFSKKSKGKLMSGHITPHGYVAVMMRAGDRFLRAHVHRLVAIAFLPNPLNKRTVNHINGIKTDNRVENLEWATDMEQITHARKNGLTRYVRGSETGMAKLNEQQVYQIKRGLADGGSNIGMSKVFGVSVSTIEAIKYGKIWKHVQYPRVLKIA